MKSLSFFVIGLAFWLMVAFSGPARSADEMGYKLVGLNQSVRKAIGSDSDWKACGNYFAAGESTEGKIVHFIVERKLYGYPFKTFIFVTTDHLIVSIERKVAAPVVIVLKDRPSTQYILRMNAKDYVAGLPCLAKGEKV